MFPVNCDLGIMLKKVTDISRKQKHPCIIDISSDSEFDINDNHTILYANSSVGIDTSDVFCEENSVRKNETLRA